MSVCSSPSNKVMDPPLGMFLLVLRVINPSSRIVGNTTIATLQTAKIGFVKTAITRLKNVKSTNVLVVQSEKMIGIYDY